MEIERMNFYCFLKRMKQLIITGTQRGGVPIYNGSPKPVTSSTPCDQENGYITRFVTPFILTITWDENANNGLVNIQLDEYYSNRWNRTLGVGGATPSLIEINEVDGVEATLQFESNRYFFNRDRDYKDPQPPTSPLQMFSSDGKQISVAQRDQILGCRPRARL